MHYNNKTIITCANFTQAGQPSSGSSGSGAGAPVSSVIVPVVSSVAGGAPGSGQSPAAIVSTATVSVPGQTVTTSPPAAGAGSAGVAPQHPGVSTVTVNGAIQVVTVTSMQGPNGV